MNINYNEIDKMGELEPMTEEEMNENLQALAELHDNKTLNDMTDVYMSEYGYPYK